MDIPNCAIKKVPPKFVTPTKGVTYCHTRWVKGDGNCQFSAFARAVGNGVTHTSARNSAIQWIMSHPSDFAPFIERERGQSQSQALANYLQKMSQSGQWGDNLTLEAMTRSHKAYVLVLKRSDTGHMAWSRHGHRDSAVTLFWLYLANSHYEHLLHPTQLL